MNHTVVVGVTDKPSVRRAVEWAARRASARGDRVTLMSVVGGAIGVVGEKPVIDAALAGAQTLLDEQADRVRAHGVPCTSRVERGKPVDKLIEASKDAALLVIGSDYRGPGHGPERGPHGMRITAGAHCPVVVIPDVDLRDRRGVVVGIDGSETSEAALKFAALEAADAQEPLTAISTWSPVAGPLDMKTYPGSYLENMQKLTEETLGIALAGLTIDYPDLVVHRIVEAGYPETAINKYAATAKLAVVGSHGRGPISRFLLGSTSQAVLARLATATTVVR